MLTAFPHLTTPEFDRGCSELLQRFLQCRHAQTEWHSVDTVFQHDTKHLRITRDLRGDSDALGSKHEPEQDDFQEADDEALQVPPNSQALIHYDILLSPIYRVPVLYISISDPQHRYPPTMATLYSHLIPPKFQAQAESGGVIGGISVTDHPVTNRPVFFIHPCQTTEVMGASIGATKVTAEEYLILWMGALGKCVDLNVPLALMQRGEDETEDDKG